MSADILAALQLRHEITNICEAEPEDRFRMLLGLIRQWLTFEMDMRRKMLALSPSAPPLRYSCTEELVLLNGNAKLAYIQDSKFPRMQVGNCFGNAFRLTLENPELRYVEGWACMEQGVPAHHGWVEHPDGSVSDPTWLGLVEDRLADPNTNLTKGWQGRCVYLGVSIPLANHLAWFEEHETPNLLAFGEMMSKEVLMNGTDAWAAAITDPDLKAEAVAAALDVLLHKPQWQLSDDGDHYWRYKDDGTVERWFGNGRYVD